MSSSLAQAVSQKTPFFYGWVIVSFAFFILALAYGVQYSFGVFIPVMMNDLGWDRATLGGAFSLYAMVYLSITVVSGRLTDLWGPKVVLSIGGFLIGIGLIGTSRATEPWHIFFWYGLVAALGMSTAYIPCNVTVARWFQRRRGLAVGLASSGSSCGIFIVPLIAVMLLGETSWRTALAGLGSGLLVLTLVSARFMVRSPADLGLQVDGASGASETGSAADITASWSFAQARHTSCFWIFAIGFLFTLIPMPVPFVHLPVFALDLKLSDQTGASAVSIVGFSALVGGISLGSFSDRVGPKNAFLVALAAQGLAFICLLLAKSSFGLFLGAVAFGVFYGGFSAIFPALFIYLFGPLHAATIGGVIIGFGGLLGSWGPALVGYLRDTQGNYQDGFGFCLASSMIAIVLTTILKPPATKGLTQ
ncbi:MAG: MFS transporter [Pseudomonadota bacterium]